MSYSGFTQVWCKNGHYFSYDCFDSDNPTRQNDPWNENKNNWKCPICKDKVAFINEVDQTNCCTCSGYEEKDFRLESCGYNKSWNEIQSGCKFQGLGYIQPVIAVSEKICTCCDCGNKHVAEPAKYIVPNKTEED